MGGKFIGRMAAGACSVCLCYGLAVQALQSQPKTAELAADAAVVEQAAEPAEEMPDALSPETGGEAQFFYDVPRRHGVGGRRHGWHENSDTQTPFGQSPSNQEQEPSDTEEDEEKKKKSEEQTDSSDSEQNSSASGDPPTLNQFLSTLRCGGCGHNCSLLNPRCMRGRSKAERAQTEYAQTYGSDSK